MDTADGRIPMMAVSGQQVEGPATGMARAVQAVGGMEEIRKMKQQQADEQVLNSFLKSGGNLATPAGIADAVGSLKGRVSVNMYGKLLDLHQNSEANVVKLQQMYAQMPGMELQRLSDQKDYIATQLEAPLNTYRAALGSGDEASKTAALQNFEAVKQKLVADASNMRGVSGQPVMDQKYLARIMDMTPAELFSELQTTRFHQEQIKAGLQLQKDQAQIAFQTAEAEKNRAQAVKFRAEAAAESRKAQSPIGKLNADLRAGWITQDEYDKAMQKEAGGLGARGQQIMMRIQGAATEATAELKNVVEMPISVSTGVFGSAKPGETLMGSTFSALANKMTSEDVQAYKTTVAGIQRNLAAIEASGLMPSGSLTHQMDAVVYKEGDTNLTKMRKLATTRQIIEKGLEPLVNNPSVPQEEKEYMQTIIEDVKGAVPFTVHDVNEMLKAKEHNPKMTPMQFLSEKNKTGTTKPEVHESLPPASQYDGKIAVDQATGDRFKSINGQWVKQ